MLETEHRDGLTQCRLAGARWLATGPDGGYVEADAAYNCTVPEGFDRTDLAAYAAERRADAGFDVAGPTLLTGVAQRHARVARNGPVAVLATTGLSNPAALPVATDGGHPAGTVNLVVATSRALDDGTLATLVSTCVEAKAATLEAIAGVPGTTSDGLVVGTVPDGDPAEFAGSATAVGAAARACVRDAVRASFTSRYEESDPPASVAEAEHGVRTDREPTVEQP